MLYLAYLTVAIFLGTIFDLVLPVQAYPLALQDCSCSTSDQYDPKARMPGGLFKGQCINSCEQRSVKIIKQDNNSLTIANFRHQQQFWIATIPLDSLEDVIYQTEEIFQSCPACHSQLRFRFRANNPVILKSQTTLGEREVTVRDIVYSVEATGLPGMNFDPLSALLDFYGLSYRFISLEDRADRMINVDQHIVNQLRLVISNTEGRRLLQETAKQSDRIGMSRMYNLFDRNCTSELFRILDTTVSKKLPKTPQLFINLPSGDFISYLMEKTVIDWGTVLKKSRPEIQKLNIILEQAKVPKDALQERGLLNSQSRMITLNEELNRTK